MPDWRPSPAEFDLAEEIENYYLRTPAAQRPTLAGIIATRVAKYRAEMADCLRNVVNERNQLRADLQKLDADVAVDLRFNGKLMGLLAAARGLLREYDNTREPEHQRRVNEAAELVMVETRRIEEASHG
jgi:hypothetical protein